MKKDELRRVLRLNEDIDIISVEEEANNNTIDKIVDRAYEYKNFKFFRLRALVILHQSYSEEKNKKVKKKSTKKWWKFHKKTDKKDEKKEKNF